MRISFSSSRRKKATLIVLEAALLTEIEISRSRVSYRNNSFSSSFRGMLSAAVEEAVVTEVGAASVALLAANVQMTVSGNNSQQSMDPP